MPHNRAPGKHTPLIGHDRMGIFGYLMNAVRLEISSVAS